MGKTIVVTTNTLEKMKQFYKSDFVKTPPYAIFSAKSNQTTITAYNSMKVVFQGENADYEASIWTNEAFTKPTSNYHEHIIGSDEVGKGDYFGPLIVCASFVDQDIIELAKGLGIKDSKKMTDSDILKIGEILSKKVCFSLLKVDNVLYNTLKEQGLNVNEILAKTHNKAILNLVKKLNQEPKAIVDEFASRKNYLKYLSNDDVYPHTTLVPKAEDKYLAVAISSILARYQFLNDIDVMSKKLGKKVLLGASSKVDQLAADLYLELGKDEFKNYVKISFKNTEKVLKLVTEGK
jgi:ribonuclease HIII